MLGGVGSDCDTQVILMCDTVASHQTERLVTLDLVIKRDESPVNDIKGQDRLACQWRNGLRRSVSA